jgi:hypothetical protein
LFGADGTVKGESFKSQTVQLSLKIIDIAEPNNFGIWKETCGETYLFGKNPVWRRTYKSGQIGAY